MQKKAIQGHTRTHKAMLILMRSQIVMAVKNSIKAIQGHIRPYKANAVIQYHECHRSTFFVPLLAQFLFDFEHFSFMFPRQEEEEQQQQQQQQQQSFF